MMDTIDSSDIINQPSHVDGSTSTPRTDESQVLELKLQLECLNFKYKKSLAEVKLAKQNLQRLQEEVEQYYLISERQKKIIESLENLQSKSTEIIYDHVMK